MILFVIAVGARYVDSTTTTPFVPEHQATGWRGGKHGARDHARLVRQLRGARRLQRSSRDRVRLHRVRPDRHLGRGRARARAPASRAASSSPSAWSPCMYLAMAAVLVGIRPYAELGTGAPVSDALAAAGAGWAVDVVNVGRGARPDHGDHGGADRAEPGALRDGSRRPAARVPRPGHLVVLGAERGGRPGRYGGGAAVDVVRAGRPGAAAGHRRALVVPGLLDRGDRAAPQPARPRARLPRPAGAAAPALSILATGG